MILAKINEKQKQEEQDKDMFSSAFKKSKEKARKSRKNKSEKKNAKEDKWFYSKQDDINKSLIIVIAVQFVVFIILSACFFFGYMSIPLGFLLGSIIADLNFKMLEKQMDYILNAGRPTSKRKGIANMMIRSLLYLIGLIIAGLLAYFK